MWTAAVGVPAKSAVSCPMTPELRARAAEQGGAFTWQNAMSCGVRPRDASRALEGAWTTLFPGVYVETQLWDALDAWGKHLVRLRGRLLRKSSAWMAGRRSGALVHNLLVIGQPPEAPQLMRGYQGKRPKARSRHERIATLYEGDATTVGGVPTASLGRVVCDIARDESFRNAVVTADSALRAGLTREELVDNARRFVEWPNGAAAMRVARFANGLAESALESISRVAIEPMKLGVLEQQVEVWIGDRLVARLDFLLREANVGGMADGDLKYDSRADVLADKRQQELLEDVGLEVVRWGWEFPWRKPDELEARLRRATERGSRQTLDPRVRLVPVTLERSIELARRYRPAS